MKKLLSLLSVLIISVNGAPSVIAIIPYSKIYYKEKISNFKKINRQKRESNSYFINKIIIELLDIDNDYLKKY